MLDNVALEKVQLACPQTEDFGHAAGSVSQFCGRSNSRSSRGNGNDHKFPGKNLNDMPEKEIRAATQPLTV